MNRDDAFELRLADWLEEGPFRAPERGIEPAIAHAAAHPRSRLLRAPVWRGRRWRPAIHVPRLTWLALALLALLLLGVAFVTGSRLTAVVPPSCPTTSTPDKPGDPALARPNIGEYIGGSVAWDAHAGRIVLLTRGAVGAGETTGAIWTFDVCANRWHRELGPITVPGRGPVVHDDDSDLTVAIGDESVWAFDLARSSWTRLPGAPPAWVTQTVYDPSAGLLIGRDASRQMWTYDVTADRWAVIDPHGSDQPESATGGFELMSYDRSVDRVVLATGWGTWLFDPDTGAWVRDGLREPIGFYIGDHQIAWDTRHARTLVFGDGRLVAYDAATHDWTLLYAVVRRPGQTASGDSADRGAGYGLEYDPLNDRLIVVGGTTWDDVQGWLPTDGVIAFDLVTREWIELLAPSR